MEKPKRKRKPPGHFWIESKMFLFGFLGGAMILILCTVISIFTFLVLTIGNSYSGCFGTPFPSHADVEESSFFKFPPSAQQIEYDADMKNRGCSSWITFSMESQDINEFQESTLVDSLQRIRLEGTVFYIRMKDKGWSQQEESLAGYGSNADYDYPWVEQWIFVDMSSADQFTVYVIIDKNWL